MDRDRDTPTFRFAPSPNGLLHLGHAFSALTNDAMARRAGGRLLLRFEDIDRQRCTEDYARAIEEDLRWLGLAWETPVRCQSGHFPLYAAALRDLEARGLAYRCFCTRGMIQAAVAGRHDWPSDPDGVPLYPGLCRCLDVGERRRRIEARIPFFWRLDMARALAETLATITRPLEWTEIDLSGAPWRRVEAAPARWGDAMVARKDVPTSYHLSVVLDDAAQGVSDIVRGRDLFEATGLHRLLQSLLGLPVPRYHHHALILDEAGRKLSKSREAPSLRAMRHTGMAAAEVRHRLGFG